MSIFKVFVDSFKEVFKKLLAFIRDPAKRKQAEAVLKEANDIAVFAVEAVRLVATLTPTPIDDRLVEALARGQRTAEEILNETDPDKREGMIRGLARELVRYLLEKRVGQEGSIRIGNRILVSLEAVQRIANHVINTAVELAYTVLKNGDALPQKSEN